MKAKIIPGDYVTEQPHSSKTERTIERVVEFAEDATSPFTKSDAWRRAYGNYQCVCTTLRSMEKHGLLVRTNSIHTKPAEWLSVDRYEEWTRDQRSH